MPRVSAVEVTRAVRDSIANGLSIHAGDVMALVDDEIVQAGDNEAAVIEAVLRNQEHPARAGHRVLGRPGRRARRRRPGRPATGRLPRRRIRAPPGRPDHYPYILSLECGAAAPGRAQAFMAGAGPAIR